MPNSLLTLSALAALGTAAQARNLFQPKATASASWSEDGVSPAPTQGPILAELRKRDATTAYIAPDNTCGYISGLIGAAYTCGAGGTCAFLTATAGIAGHVACCDNEGCGVRFVCLDYRDVFISSQCNNGCEVDTNTVKCTNSLAPYCNTISFSGDIIDYWCGTASISVFQAAVTTYSGETDGRSFFPLVLTGTAASSIAITSAKATGTGGSPVSSGPATSSTSGGGGSSGDSNGGSSSSGGSSAPIGAIVGGVIGGLAVLGLVALGIFFLLRKKSPSQGQQPSKADLASPMSPLSPMQQQPPPAGAYNMAPQYQSVYDPKYATAPPGQPQMGQPPMGQVYPPAQYQTTPPPPGYYPPGTEPDRAQTTSPAVSHMTDNRMSSAHPSVPSPQAQAFGQQLPYDQQPPAQLQPTIHEAGGEAVGMNGYNAQNHHGQMHEML